MTTFRDEERALAIAEALKEGLNTNGMHRTISPPSTRMVAESQTVEHEPTVRDRAPSGMCGSVEGFSRVRDRQQAEDATKAINAAPLETQLDPVTQAWLDYENLWKDETGHYVRR